MGIKVPNRIIFRQIVIVQTSLILIHRIHSLTLATLYLLVQAKKAIFGNELLALPVAQRYIVSFYICAIALGQK